MNQVDSGKLDIRRLHSCSDRDPNRPDFGPNQVRCLHLLIPGQCYDLVPNVVQGLRRTVKVVAPPDASSGEVEVEYISSQYRERLVLSSYSLESHPYNHWNHRNWVAFTDESRLTAAALAATIS